jgi:NAD(P)H dehydrogenase (quinone)
MHDAAMKISVILGHPNLRSFNHAIAGRVVASLARAGQAVTFHDLYGEGFDPVITGFELATDDVNLNEQVARHCREIASAEGIVVIHPNWWGMPPAIMKGWVDRVLRPGVAYRFADDDDGSGSPMGLLRARVAVVMTTSNTPAERERQVFGDPLDTLWRNCIFGFCGVANVIRHNFGVVAGSTLGQRQQWLAEAEAVVSSALASE